MNLELKYLGRSGMRDVPGGSALTFEPNLARARVFFDQELRFPLRFREAISALHEVVVGDFKYRGKDRSAHEAWKNEQQREEDEVRRVFFDQAKKAQLARITKEPVPPNLEEDFRRLHDVYWRARRQWATELARNDPELFRHLVPCDPVVTVAPDVVFFEGFAKDESSYGSLFVDRDAFAGKGESGLGTTNVDYSVALYEHFQTLRTYRPTRLLVDPSGFEVNVAGHEDYREEKIDLPPTWLRGFGQLQAAMSLPTRTVELSVDALYSILAFLKRHREKAGPRSLKFLLAPNRAPTITVEPWGKTIVSHGPAYGGERAEEIKVWGRRRLLVLSRLLPLAEKVVVQLLGSGLPSIWTVHLGEMRFVLGLSGWSANDWTSGASLEFLSANFQRDARAVELLGSRLGKLHSATVAELAEQSGLGREVLLGSLHELAKQGQVVYDFARARYRWRPVMPVALSEAVLGPEPEEVRLGKALFRQGKLKVVREEPLHGAKRLLVAEVSADGFGKATSCEAIFDADGVMTKAKCGCSHFYRSGLRAGPCRHLLALRLHVSSPPRGPAGDMTPGASGPGSWIH